jgi:hypothetical protein
MQRFIRLLVCTGALAAPTVGGCFGKGGESAPPASFSVVDSLRMADEEGGVLRLDLTVKGRRYQYLLRSTGSLYADDAVIEINEGKSQVLSPRDFAQSISYASVPTPNSPGAADAAVVTRFEDGSISGLLTSKGGDGLLQIESVDNHPELVGESVMKQRNLPTRYVVTKVNSDTEEAQKDNVPCGVVDDGQRTGVNDRDDQKHDAARGQIAPRALESVDNYVKFVDGCYPDDSVVRKLKIGVVVDKTYYQKAGNSSTKVRREVEATLAKVKEMYRRQLNLDIVIGQLKIVSPSASGVPSVYKQDCTMEMGEQLNRFTAAVDKSEVAHWHLLTGCNRPGPLGLGFLGTLCGAYNTAVSRRGGAPRDWATIAHEMGHVFGARHSVPLYGDDLGIMGYSDKMYNGVMQFAPPPGQRTRTEICDTLSRTLSRCGSSIELASNEKCGNGLLELDEECECISGASSCAGCKSCKLTEQERKCSTNDFVMRTRKSQRENAITLATVNELSAGDCCRSSGTELMDGTTACTTSSGLSGICLEGECFSNCASFGIEDCGPREGGCQQGCWMNTSSGPKCSTNLAVREEGGTLAYPMRMPNGTQCRLENGGAGTCDAGKCR